VSRRGWEWTPSERCLDGSSARSGALRGTEKSGLTEARISEIETGKISNPQAKTIDALRVAMNISREERAAYGRSMTFSHNPVFLAGRERAYEGLRLAGVPEG
jgi:transcriptional regulator with XRE-family HTH domain